MRKRRPPDDLRGTPEFEAFYSSLGEDCELRKVIKDCLDSLRRDMFVGDKIEKKKWPKKYVKEYGIRVLFKLDATRECRLTYNYCRGQEESRLCDRVLFES